MRWLRRLLRAIRPMNDDRGVEAELRLHVEMETDDLVSQGLPRAEARRRALVALGGLERFRAEAREVRRGRWLNALPSELLWAWRGVRGRGLGSVFHVGVVGLTMAASAVVFSAADAYVFRPVPYPAASRLMVFQHNERAGRGPDSPTDTLDAKEILLWRQHADLFSSIQAYESGPSVYLTIEGVTESVQSEAVTPGLFGMLGVRPRWGRPLLPGDERPGQPSVVVIGAALARRLFGDAAHAVDRTLQSGSESPRIVGVMPAGFRFPSALEQIWRPLKIDGQTSSNGTRLYHALALTAPGASLDVVTRGVAARRPLMANVLRLGDVTIRSLSEARRDPHSVLFVTLLGSAICLLLVACLNVASLELAAALGRTRMYAVQTALGATRSTLVRTALIEGALLTGVGALAALGLASWGTAALTALLPPALVDRLSHPIDVDLRVVIFLAGVTVLTWMLTSTPVVWRASRPSVADGLRHVARATTISRTHAAARHVLMTGQVALTVLLLVGALLFVRSYAARLAQDKGFDSARLATIQVLTPPRASEGSRPLVVSRPPARDSRRADLEGAILSRLRAVPSVVSVSRSSSLLPSMAASLGSPLQIDGRAASEGWVYLRDYDVDTEYFTTLGIRLRAGRWFGLRDSPGTLVVDETFAQRFWPKGDALNAQFRMNAGTVANYSAKDEAFPFLYKIVGIAAHVRGDSVENPTGDGVFVVYEQIPEYYSPLAFVIRLDDPADLGSLTGLVRSMATGCIVRSTLIDERYARLYGDTRVAMDITSGFGLVALVVATVGVYGLMAFLVMGRTREIGIRMALGANPSDIRRLVLGSATGVVMLGAIIGMAAAAATSHVVQSQLFGVSSTDPVTYGVVTAIIVATALLATWRPAQRAANIDPAVTLRAE